MNNKNVNNFLPDAQIMNIKDGKRAIVTVIHDDGDVPTVCYMNEVFEKNGLKGTMALAAAYIDKKREVIQEVLGQGRFNLACHSYSHKYIGENDEAQSGVLYNGTPFSIPAGNMTREIKTSKELLKQAFAGERVLCYVNTGVVYPEGSQPVSDAARKMIKESYISARTTNSPDYKIPPDDWHRIPSLMVQQSHDAQLWIDSLDTAIEKNGWLLFCFHCICEESEAGGIHISKDKAERFFKALADRVASGDIWCTYFDEASIYIKEAISSSLSFKAGSSTDEIRLSVTNGLDSSIYNIPITVKVKLPDTFTSIEITQGANKYTTSAFEENGIKYAYANIIPNIGDAIIAKSKTAS